MSELQTLRPSSRSMPPLSPRAAAAATGALSTGADHLLACLQAEQVQAVFVHPGAVGLPVFEQLHHTSIETVFLRHEQSVLHAADGYARASGQVGVCLITSGAGVANAITGIETAHLDSIPLVILVAQSALPATEEIDTHGLTRSCLKHSLTLDDIDAFEATVKKAFFLARTGRPGPVLVQLAGSVLNDTRTRPFDYSGEVRIRAYAAAWAPAHRQLRLAAEAIRGAQRPLIYFGGGVVLGQAHAQLRALAEITGAPVTGTLMGLGAFDATHPQWIGMLGMHGLYEANMTMQHCDVLVAVGARFDDRVIGNTEDFARTKRRIIHIDVDPTSISKRVAVDIPIVGHCAVVLDSLNEMLAAEAAADLSKGITDWWSQIQSWRETNCLSYPRSDAAIKPQRVIELLSAMPEAEDFVITSDVGQHQMWTAQHFQFRQPRQWINSGGLGTMGFGLPAAIGAAISAAVAGKKKTIVCISGDGSLQMSTKELVTCLQYGLAIKIICLNNSQLGMVRQQQDLYHGRRRSQSYMEALPDFVKLAEAYGHRGLRITSNNELEASLRQAVLDRERLVLVDILVDRTENVYPTLAPGKPLTDMILRAPIDAEDL